MISIVEEHGVAYAAKEIDVVTTGTFGMMCSSGAFFNFGHSDPPIKMEHLWLNNVHCYHGGAAVDAYIGVTRMASPRNFEYGGGHVLEDFVRGKKVHLSATAYGTDCYPRTNLELDLTLEDLNQAILCNPRNGYERYNCAVNASSKTIYTYMGKLLPNLGNASYSGAGALSPINNDPKYETIGIGTHIFLCGGDGIVTNEGTQHKPQGNYGTLMVQGDLKKMNSEFLSGASMKGYGTTAFIGMGIPIPVLNEGIAKNCAISDDKIKASVTDYSTGRRNRPELSQVSYEELKSGKIEVNGKEIKVTSLSSLYKARQIANILKTWIKKGEFLLYRPVRQLATEMEFRPMPEISPIPFVKNLKKAAVTIKESATVKDVAQAALKYNENHIVVVDQEDKLKGFLTTYDLAKAVADSAKTLREIMIPKHRVHTVRDTDPSDLAIRIMKQYSISSLPVIDKDEKVVGLISAEELIEAREPGGRDK
jgi:uncharacterized protein (DUF39 family)/CBS domain-containing protein